MTDRAVGGAPVGVPEMVIGPAEVETCPHCGTTSGVKVITGTPPKVHAWSCAACGTDRAITVVNPRPFLDRLTATVKLAAVHSILRGIISLADAAPWLTDQQLRCGLAALAVRAARRSRPVPVPLIPAGHRSNHRVHGVQPYHPEHADLARESSRRR